MVISNELQIVSACFVNSVANSETEIKNHSDLLQR